MSESNESADSANSKDVVVIEKIIRHRWEKGDARPYSLGRLTTEQLLILIQETGDHAIATVIRNSRKDVIRRLNEGNESDDAHSQTVEHDTLIEEMMVRLDLPRSRVDAFVRSITEEFRSLIPRLGRNGRNGKEESGK